ncbi:helix-turn-helix domain-containing protein [Candidatus Clostridium helianthi]|jgi:transcriptional regulator with XRE-family HTH domain|uniref:Helix-turn-helix domain-containing protein n=1 Tax=Candidatus Clostridium helianthi TaxID=3381660 RepID=A0ABW8S1F0_9CLOT
MQNIGKNSLGSFIKELRKSKGVSLEEMETGTGLSRSYINRLENSSRDNPTLDCIGRLIQYFDIPFSSMAEFCNCQNSLEDGRVQNLDFILLNERYLFANLEVDMESKTILRNLIQELENYTTSVSVCRQDEAKILDIVGLLRERLSS